jgi:hypothetical protein
MRTFRLDIVHCQSDNSSQPAESGDLWDAGSASSSAKCFSLFLEDVAEVTYRNSQFRRHRAVFEAT